MPRDLRSMALSAPRSFLFNRILEQRVIDATWNRLVPGDWASLDSSGSVFRVDRVDRELERRCEQLDVHPSGPLWGAGDPVALGDVAELEMGTVRDYPEFVRGLEDHGVRMARRALRLAVRDLSWDRSGEELVLNFFLARGGFATAVLREIAAYED